MSLSTTSTKTTYGKKRSVCSPPVEFLMLSPLTHLEPRQAKLLRDKTTADVPAAEVYCFETHDGGFG